MKKILGIVGSLRASGNSELMIKQISRELKEPHVLQLLRLPEFRLNYCNGCFRCLLANRGCVIPDDLHTVLDAIVAADALILAVPTYFLAAHSCLKVFIDRGISFYSRAEELWGKPAVGVGIAGGQGNEGSTLLDIERFLLTLQARNKRSEIMNGALPGEVLLSENNRTIAGQLAEALFATPEPKTGLHCPFCLGETFRFYPDNQVRCMLCSQSGTLVSSDNRLTIEMALDERPFLASETDALHHRDWLIGTVGRFKEQKTALAKVRAEFSDEASWVLPTTGLRNTRN